MHKKIKHKYYIAIPTYNGGRIWRETVESISKNSPDNTPVYIIDSGSKDDTVNLARDSSFNVTMINSKDFNHGGTRNSLVKLAPDGCDIVIFLTQDAIPQSGFIENILSVFCDENIACAYGRQLPHHDANPLACHARYFNYSNKGYICSSNDISELGLKTVFMSNSFSAYRLSIFKDLGGFPENTILCEDMYFTAKAVKKGYKVAYVENAVVRHSHNYSPMEEFRRYFDIGVFHAKESWIQSEFGGAKGEGSKFIFSELRYLFNKDFKYIPLSFVNNMMKLIGYKLGLNYKKIPLKITKRFSMHKSFWNSKELG